ncbi:MAG: tRNA (pseudouridine(54)-N(1))-methyltransferase TrmY [Candidatus Aenigmarchaeota archaeon]|nr:tRNA (pseudouridine(54)-N(1))-methyltransferase TrmY [Candidatus Aenigmarchaeota archaeon]MDI6722756.1 tRNA (pseudouridine(54)-N(1))-methyltransferase TrmY [Candidatus Aenigmarchaeota archaeon]
MREFILRARKASTHAGFDLNDLPHAGNMNVVASAISNAIWISGDIRRDIIFHAVLEGPPSGPKTVTFNSNEIKGLGYDEKSVANYIRTAMQKSGWLELNEEAKVRKGITVAKKSFERLVWERSQNNQVVILDKSGTDIRKFEFKKNILFVFGDNIGLPQKTERFFKGIPSHKISLGPKTLFASHCPVIVHNELDRRGL